MLDEAIYILDTSAIITFKKVVKAKEQWDLAKFLEDLVKRGRITFPRQVVRELSRQRHIDLPEAWTLGVVNKLTAPSRPDPLYIEKVIEVASDVIEQDAENDPEDPYVLALSLQLHRDKGRTVCYVVTEDKVDRLPIKSVFLPLVNALALATLV